ncbi:protein Flattop [Pelobates fuscus]|uniref:protein Flattop n=1 Tax=Pelobates fuscus TaxID=191477 RepID=UPI002FE4E297
MAANYSANQYQSAFNARSLQNWNVSKLSKEKPSTHDGYAQFIANDRGHLLPDVPKSKEDPWGSFVGTWDMPKKMPPAKISLTSRSVQASKRLLNWIDNSSSFISANNGLRPDITGKPSGDVQDVLKCSNTISHEKSECHAEKKMETSAPPPPKNRSRPSTGGPERSKAQTMKSP